MIKAKAPHFVKSDSIGPDSQDQEFYLEKLHIWDRNSSQPLK